jgi:putative transcriptional regulator
MESLTGRLLIAGPDLWDPSFRHAIVLLGHHDDQGAVGVVLNRSLEVTVREAVPALADLVGEGEPVFGGGPVEPGGVVVLAEFADPSVAEVLALGSIGFLPPETPAELGKQILRARVFAGYAGWEAGQLEEELAQDAWILEPATPGDVFHPNPSRLRDEVLRRKGRAFDLIRLMPADPSSN